MPRVDHSIPFKKIDFLVSYDEAHAQVQQLVDAIQSKYQMLFLSPTQDICAACSPQLAAIEVKCPEGVYLSSSLQLATWLAAGLEKTRQLYMLAGASKEGRTAESLMPLMGVTVVGHFWLLYIAEKDASGKVVGFHLPLPPVPSLSLPLSLDFNAFSPLVGLALTKKDFLYILGTTRPNKHRRHPLV